MCVPFTSQVQVFGSVASFIFVKVRTLILKAAVNFWLSPTIYNREKKILKPEIRKKLNKNRAK